VRAVWRALFHRRQWEHDLEDELRGHVELRAADLIRRGLTPADAMRQARLEFGAAETYKEDCRQAHGLRWLEEIRQDVRYVLRTLRRSPGFTAAAVLSLALGIGANSAVFSFVNALLLKPLPIQHPEQVWFVQSGRDPNLSFPDFRDYRDRNRTLDLAAYRITVMSLERDGSSERVWGYLASGNYFDLLGVRPVLGRFFQPAEDVHPGASPYPVLSYGCWERRFGADPHIAGRSVRINGLPYTVLGVAPREFHGTELFYWPEIWVPITMEAQIESFNWLDARNTHNSMALGRLKPGVRREQAAADLTAIAADLARQFPKSNEARKMTLARPGMVGDTLGAPAQAFSAGLMALAGLVLLAACANLASLLAARAADRSRELAIRLSIGSGRGRILRQLLTESLVLAALGGAAGCALALAASGALSRWRPPVDFPGALEIRPDWRVFAFSAAATLAAGLLSGLAPARQAWRADPNSMLKGGPARRGGPGRLALRDVLVAAQVAICCALVACCFVSIRGLNRAFSTSLGFQPRGVAVVAFDLDLARYSKDAGRQFQRRALDAVSHVPGVQSVAFANTLPLNPDESSMSVFREDTVDRRPVNALGAVYYQVSPGYLRTIGTRLLSGRDFDWHDDGKAAVAIVNERLARQLTGTANAAGRRFRDHGGNLVEIVGVVEDGKYQTLTEDPAGAIFWPSTQSYSGTTLVLARSSLPEPALAAAMREAVAPLDPHLPLYDVGSAREMQQLAFLPSRAAVSALTVFGALALILAITGIYGLSAYSVSRRVREIGIRVAVGAGPREVLSCVLRRMGWLVAIGSFAGLVLAWLAGQVLAAVVYHATSHDPLVLGATAATLAVAGLGASVGPARRALHIEPSRALRHD
jgi:predicted permease